jgi:hypothetical protein
MIVPVRLRFPFELQFIPKKGRNDRTGSFYGDGYGMVRRAEPAEVCPAFRLHFPRMPRRRAFKVELIWLDGRLWWPLQGYNFLPFDSTLSADPVPPGLGRRFVYVIRGEKESPTWAFFSRSGSFIDMPRCPSSHNYCDICPGRLTPFGSELGGPPVRFDFAAKLRRLAKDRCGHNRKPIGHLPPRRFTFRQIGSVLGERLA